jgi:SpoVK/Ycf46/Vps4 family AAA+-type ATPase
MNPPIDWLSDARNKNTKDTPPEDLSERLQMFKPEPPRRQLADLVLNAETSQQLRTALAKIKHHHLLYHTWGLASIHPEGRGIALNLYGPPGTGKSFAAEAIADHLQKPIIRIDYAQIESRFVGDTPKNITMAFAAAREANAVLFFDEADSVLSRRATNITQAADYGVNVSRSTMLLQLDRAEGVVLFATNLAANYDQAFVRRILAHIHFPLPNVEGLIRLWEYHLPRQLPREAAVTPALLADLSIGLSGGEVLNAVLLAASEAAEQGAAALSLEAFERAIQQVHRAKQEVGAG